MEEAISHSNHTRQTPGYLSCSDLGRPQNAGPTEFVPLRTTQMPELEWLRPGRCIWPGASLGLPAPPRSKPLRFRHSGSPQRRRLSWACVLCSSQVRAAQVMRCLASANVVTYRLPATQLSGCKTGAPSQADVVRPDPQEVLVSKEACLQFYR